MGICPDCGSWIDEGEPYCSCGSTKGVYSSYDDNNSYNDSYESPTSRIRRGVNSLIRLYEYQVGSGDYEASKGNNEKALEYYNQAVNYYIRAYNQNQELPYGERVYFKCSLSDCISYTAKKLCQSCPSNPTAKSILERTDNLHLINGSNPFRSNWDDELESRLNSTLEREEKIRQRKLEEERRKREEELEREREIKRQRAEAERRRREYEERKRREREENEKNPEYLANQINVVKNQVFRNRFLLLRGQEHLIGIQERIDNAFKEVLRLQEKLDKFDIECSYEYDALNDEVYNLKKENNHINYIISHMDDKYCENAKKLFIRNMDELEILEAKFDEKYPKRGLFNIRDRKSRTKINFD